MKRSASQTQLEGKEIKAIGLSILFLALGCFILWLVKSVIGIQSDAAFVSLVLIPLLAYVILSGKLEELKGPGGLEAKFAKAAGESVTVASEEVKPSVEEMQMVFKESVGFLEREKKKIDETKPIVMILEVGKSNYYGRDAVLKYLEVLSQFRNFNIVVFVDKNQRFLACMSSRTLKELLSKQRLGEEFIQAINEGNLSELRRYPGLIKYTIHSKSTNAEALNEMMTQNLKSLLVVDENDHLVGVVEREQVLSRMMLSLVK